MFPEQYSKSDFLFDTLKWNNKIDFVRGREAGRQTGDGKENERQQRQI